jgi:hypothetical protein
MNTMAGVDDLTAAWHTLCERLTAIGTRVGEEPFPASGTEHAVDVRHLARQLVLALQGELEHGDATRPSFHRYEEPWAQWGGPNPDNVYTRAAIDPAATYRVTGNVAGVRTAILSLVEGDMHLGRYGVFEERTLADLEVRSDGALALWIAPDARDGNWLPAHPDARYLLVRQYQCDWEPDRVATLAIERVDTIGVPPHAPSESDLVAALGRVGDWVERSVDYWCTYVERARESLPRNAMAPPGTPKGGAPNIAYGAGWWELGPDDALVVTTECPDADYWGFTVHHRFRLDSGDFAARATSINMSQAYVDDDGALRIVVAGTDPGVANWIDTEGRPEGMLVYRSIGTRTRPVPEAVVVPVAGVRARLPAAHPVVDASARREQLARRRAAVLARYV